jgi:hypothetical protein
LSGTGAKVPQFNAARRACRGFWWGFRAGRATPDPTVKSKCRCRPLTVEAADCHFAEENDVYNGADIGYIVGLQLMRSNSGKMWSRSKDTTTFL